MEQANPKLVAFFVRHGETEGNAKGLFRGALDYPLSDKGQKDADRLKDYFSNVVLGHAYSSDTTRARTTAETVLEPKGMVASETSDLRAWNTGYLSGLKKSEHQDDINFFQKNDNTDIPNGESLTKFRMRVQPRIKTAIINGMQTGTPSITFAHSSIIHELAHMVTGDHQHIKVKPGGIVGVYSQGNKLILKPLFKDTKDGGEYGQ